jgi:biotin synthase-like enzyme
MYNIIIFSDCAGVDWFSRGYGAYRLASELRLAGYTVLVVDFSCAMQMDMFKEIIDLTVGPDTLWVGFSVTWFPYRHDSRPNGRYSVGTRTLREPDPWDDFSAKHHEWYREGLSYRFSGNYLNDYVDYIKKKNREVKVVCGGGKSFEYLKEPALDNVFVGYSENQIIEYTNSISKKGPKRLFNKIINYDVKAQIGNFDFNNSITSYEPIDHIHSEEVMIIEMSRGCIFNCSFCSYPHRGQNTKEYMKYKESLRKELMDNWEKWGTYRYLITDDTFNDYTEKLIAIREVIQSLPFKPTFWAYIRMDLIGAHPEQAQLIKDIGVIELYWGLETWNDATAKAVKKGGTLEKKIKGLKIANECWGDDIYITAGIVIGLPKDTVHSLEEVSKWYKEEGHKYIHLLTFWPLSLRAKAEVNQYIFTSEIEDNLEKFGYTVPNDLTWTRDDEGDITSKEQADQLMFKYNAELQPFWTIRRVAWDYSAFEKMWRAESRTEIVYNFITKHYYANLIKDLREQYAMISSSSLVVEV